MGISKALAHGWISVDKSGGAVRLVRGCWPRVAFVGALIFFAFQLRKCGNVVDTVQNQLKALNNGAEVDVKALTDLKKRKLVSEV